MCFSVEKFPRVFNRGLHQWLYVKTRITYTNGNLRLNQLTKFARKSVKKVSPTLTRLLKLNGWDSPEVYERLLYDFVNRLQDETQVRKCIILSSVVSSRMRRCMKW